MGVRVPVSSGQPVPFLLEPFEQIAPMSRYSGDGRSLESSNLSDVFGPTSAISGCGRRRQQIGVKP